MVMPPGDGLVAPPAGGPSQREREPGAADQPGGGLGGEPGQPGGLGGGQLDQAGARRARLPAAGRDGRVAEGDAQVSVVSVAVVVTGAAGGRGACGGRQLEQAAQVVADGYLAELGEGGQGGVPGRPRPRCGPGTGPSRARPCPF